MACCLHGAISKSTLAKFMRRFGQSQLAARVDATKRVDLRTGSAVCRKVNMDRWSGRNSS